MQSLSAFGRVFVPQRYSFIEVFRFTNFCSDIFVVVAVVDQYDVQNLCLRIETQLGSV